MEKQHIQKEYCEQDLGVVFGLCVLGNLENSKPNFFEKKQRQVEEIWAMRESHLKETIMLNLWTQEDYALEATRKKNFMDGES